MKYKWTPTNRTNDLTIIMVARNLVTLYYPFIESIISTIPYGCKYLIGNFSNDSTKSVFEELAKYLPIEIVDMEWPLDKEPGWMAAAIGLTTQRLLEKSPTEYAINLQASEIHLEDAVNVVLHENHPWEKIAPGAIGPWEFMFNHFYGNMNHGGPGYGGYPHAPRLFQRGTKFDKWDGWCPNDYDGSYPKAKGTINRYGYCHHNTIRAKLRNHQALYDDGCAETKIPGCIALGDTQTWFGGHPLCVQHLIDKQDYDVNFSLEYAKNNLLG